MPSRSFGGAKTICKILQHNKKLHVSFRRLITATSSAPGSRSRIAAGFGIEEAGFILQLGSYEPLLPFAMLVICNSIDPAQAKQTTPHTSSCSMTRQAVMTTFLADILLIISIPACTDSNPFPTM